ncbi:MAG: NUDIX hydrolase [Paracoccaceae bacterium]
MNTMLKKAWTDVVAPMIRRPNRVQVAAVCYRTTKSDEKEVLLITSLEQHRWILPKGWPMDGKESSEAALQEAWEEAGVKAGTVNPDPIGTFEYQKQLDTGGEATCVTQVFAIDVKELADDYPEVAERERKWVSPTQAAAMVQEPQLQEILRAF